VVFIAIPSYIETKLTVIQYRLLTAHVIYRVV